MGSIPNACKLKPREVIYRVSSDPQQHVGAMCALASKRHGRYPAAELLGLSVHRWEIELVTRKWKLELRGTELLQSHNVGTAVQELVYGSLALAMLALS